MLTVIENTQLQQYLWYFHGRRLPRLVGDSPVLEALFFDFSLPDFVQGGVPGKGDDLGQSHDLPLAQGLVGAAHVLPEGSVVTHHLQGDDVRDVTAGLGQTQLGEAKRIQLAVHLEPEKKNWTKTYQTSCRYFLAMLKYVQCCEHQMNLCMSRESLLWRLCLNDLKLFLCHRMTKI